MPQPPPPPPTATASRARALKKLGLTEEDVHFSKKLFSEISSAACSNGTTSPTACSKAERLLGYTETRLKRAKALKLLGATEDDIEVECQKNLGSLGHGGRRRSFVMEMDPARNSRLHRRLSLGSSTQRRTFFGSRRQKKGRSGGGSGRDRVKSLPHSRRRRGSSSSLSSTRSTCTGSRRYTQ
jgi:hypothetical protein